MEILCLIEMVAGVEHIDDKGSEAVMKLCDNEIYFDHFFIIHYPTDYIYFFV